MNVAEAAAAVLAREGVEVLPAYPLNPGIEATRAGRPALLEFITTPEKAYSTFSPDNYQRQR